MSKKRRILILLGIILAEVVLLGILAWLNYGKCPALGDIEAMIGSKESMHRYVSQIPCYEDYIRIANYPYEVNVYDCSNMSYEYFKVLLKNGYNPKIICTYRQGDRAGHAFLWVEEFGFIDPTWNRTYAIKKSVSPMLDYYTHEYLYYQYGDITMIYDESNISERLDEFNKAHN